MSSQASSQTRLLTFAEADAASPSSLLKFLRGLVDQHFTHSTDHKAANNQWSSVIHGVLDTLGASFPTPDELPWTTLHEKIALTEVIVDVVVHCVNRIDGLFTGSATLTRKTFSRLLNLCLVLDVWIPTSPPQEPGVSQPHDLQLKALDAVVVLLRSLGGPIVNVDKDEGPSWKVLEGILRECLSVCNGSCCEKFPKTVTEIPYSELTSSHSSLSFPIDLHLFKRLPEQMNNTNGVSCLGNLCPSCFDYVGRQMKALLH
jgi:hypothetical protein